MQEGTRDELHFEKGIRDRTALYENVSGSGCRCMKERIKNNFGSRG